MEYDFATLDLSDESEAALARRRGWLGAVQRGFHGGRPDEEFEKRWLTHVRADDAVCAGAWLPGLLSRPEQGCQVLGGRLGQLLKRS